MQQVWTDIYKVSIVVWQLIYQPGLITYSGFQIVRPINRILVLNNRILRLVARQYS